MADSNPDVVDTAAEPSQPTKTAGMADAPSSSTTSEAMEPPVSAHVCAFCACGENSLLGQGPLNRYEATPGFNPFKRVLQKSRRCAGDEEKGGREKSPKHPTWRRPRGVSKGSRERSRSPRQLMSTEEELAASLGSDELANIGYPDDVEVGQVFEATGHVWAHEACAAWSEGVQTSVDKLQFVDRAVFTGLSQKCNCCKRYGASIVCKAQRCGKTFHYPCAAASGCFQDMKSLSLLCPNHVDQADITAPSAAFCVICSGGTHIGQLLFCTTCGQHNHGSCLSPEVEVKPVLRAGWQCPNCKVCQSCRRAGDDNKMLVCDTCDKGYHMYCLKPPMTAIPKNGWKCKNCRVCSDCGARTPGSGPSSRWHHNYSVCDSCYQQRNKGLCCPLCSKAYRHFDNKTMVLCNNCKKYVHSECDKTIDGEMLRRLKDGGQTDYICTVCREQGTEMDVGPFPLSSAEESVEGYPAVKDVEGFSEVSMGESTNLTMGSQESIYFEDSSSSMDVDYIPEKGLYGKDLYEGRMPSRGKFGGAGKKKFGAGRPRTRPLGEKRRTSLTFGEKRRGSKVKVKANPVAVAGQVKEVAAAAAAVPDNKEDSGDDHPSTIILSRSNDSYVHNHDICKACGSIGEESEKKLIVCVQCGQCYHPYCVTVKVTRVILQKGWRCLDCTVCEGCGSPDDEGRLLLCDDCDISYHIYCLDPPLEHVPKGTWKCKWCVYCVKCGATTPGAGCSWQQNYTQCGPCASSVVCPSCKKNYREEELIIQCVHCDRWLHAGCDGISSEDDAERAADYGYHCLFCRPKTGQPGPLPPPPPPPPPQPVEDSRPPSPPPVKEPEVPKQYLIDGVYLSASGLQQIQSLTVTMPKKPRQQRKNLKKVEKLDTLPKNPSVSRLMSLSSQEDESLDKDSDELKSMDIAMETGDGVSQSSETPLPGATPAEGAAAMPVEEVVEEGGTKKRKQRRYVGLGVGGFIARHRARTNFLKRQMSLTSEMSQDGEPALLSSEGDKLSPHAIGEHAGAGEKLKKLRRKPKKSKLEEDFPTYLQEAFFGRSTLDLSRDTVPKKVLSSGSDSDDECSRPSSPQASAIEVDGEIAKTLQLAKDTAVPSTSMAGPPRTLTPSQVSTGRSEDFDDGDLSDFLVPESLNPDDDDIMQLLRSTDFDKDEALDIDETLGTHPKLDEDNSKDEISDGLDQIMGPNFPIDQKMFPEDIDLGSIDMEMLKDVMANDAPPDQPSTSGEGQFGLSSMQGPGLPPMSRPLQSSPLGRSDSLPLPSIPNQPGQMGPMPPQDPMIPGHSHMGMQGPDGQGMPGPSGGMPPHYNMGPQTQFPQSFGHESPMSGSGQPPPWAGGAGMPSPTTAGDDEVRETSRRNILKWEADEALGANATISAVLYVNMNFPDLAKEYPDWSERSKQIAKLWKKLTPDEKNPYLAKARKNRTSSRVQKAQKQVAQEMRRRQEAQMRQDSQAMPPPPAPPPLTSPGQMGGGPDHGFLQASPEGMRPGMEGPMVSMLSPGSPMHSPGRPPLPGPGLEGSAKTSPGQSPLQSPNQPGSSPYRMEDMQKPFDPLLQSPGGSRHPEGQMHGPHPFSPGAGNRTPEGASRQMADPYAFQSGDPFAQPPGRPPNRPPASQPYDPYSQPPGTPRPGTHGEDEFGKPMHQPPFAGRPQPGQAGGDMFMPPPGAPRAVGQIRHGSPMGMMGEGGPRMRPPINDPYAFQPSTPRPSTPQDDPYAQPPGTPRPVHDPMFRGMRPQFPRMGPPPTSDPYQGLPTSQHMDPYSQQPMTPRPGPHMPPSPEMAPNRPQMMSPNKPQMMGTGPSPPYGGGMDQFRHKLVRAQSMPDPYAQPPGTPRPGMDHLSRSMSEELGPPIRPHFMPEMGKPASSMTDPSMTHQLYARRHAFFPQDVWHFSNKHPFLQTKLRMKKQQESEKMQAAGQQGGHPWQGPEAGPQGAMSPGAMPRMPGERFPPRGMMEEGMRPGFPGPRPPGPGMGMPPRHLPPSMGGMQPGQSMGPRPGMAYPGQGSAGLPISQADHIPDLDRQRMRHMQMLRQGELSSAMGQPHMGGAGGPMPPSSVAGDHQGFPGPHPQDPSLSMDMQDRAIPVSAADPLAQRAALHRPDSQAPGPDDEVFRQTPLTSARDPMISDSKPSASESSDEQGLATQGDADNLQLPDIDVHPKPSLSSEDDKHEDDDLLSADGTFDILKYADPELSHEDMEQDEKMILEHFDLIDQGDEKQRLKDDKEDTNDVDEGERSQDSSAAKSEAAMETDTSEDSKGASSKTSTSGFQSQFLEFNRKRLEMMDAEASEHSKERKEDKEAKDAKAGISHIAALLQGTDPMGARRMMGNKDDLAGDPSGGMMQRGHFQGQGMTSPMHSGQSPHHGTPTPMQQSPGGGLHGQSSQSLPSPKVLPSPRSSQPSPHTPGIQSPFNAVSMGQGQGHSPHSQPVTPGQQLSPFSQSTSVQSPFSPPTSCGQSPFSSTSVSGPQSPFPRTQSPFTMTSQTGGSQVTFGSSPQHPGAHSTAPLYSKQSSIRGNSNPPTPYMQPSYTQQLSLMQPKGQSATIGPLPSPMLYTGPMTSQHGMRNPNAPFPGGRPPFPVPPGAQGQEMINQPRMPGMPGERPMGPRGMLPPVSIPGPGAHPPEKGLMSPSSVYPSLQQQLQQGPNFPGQPRMPPHSMGPRMMGPRPNYPPTSQQGYTLLDDLVEQEKQEQKRQAEQQAFLQRRDMAGKPDPNMAGGPRMAMHMPGMPPMGPRMDHPPRMPGPDGGWAPSTSQAGPPPDMGGQFPPGFPGRPPSQQLSPRTPSPFQSSSPGMQPQVMSLGLLPPPPPPNPPPGEDGPEYHRQVLHYDEQLTKHGQYLEMQVKLLEQQISKQKRSKKTIQARQRQARKSGNELNSNDAAELERITQEQSAMQKQLEQHRKQYRQHQMTMQDYRSKHKERLSQSWPPGQPPVQAAQQVGTQPDQPPGGAQPPPATSQAGSIPSQTTLVPRMPSSQGSARMSPSARQEYEAYMQNRLRMMNQALSQGPLIRPPRGPTTIIGDNNPFSEGYQEREQREKAQLSPSATPQPRMPMHFPGEPQKSPTIPPSPGKDSKGPGQMGPFFRDPGMSFEQGPRFRAPNPFPGEGGPRPEGQRLPSPGFSGSPGMFPGMPGPQMDPRMPFNQGGPFQGFGIPPANLPSEVGPAQEQKEKPKKRRKKKKNDESDNAHSQPLPPSMPNQGAPLGQQSSSTPTSTEGSAAPTKPPPELPKPQSETDRRILEILAKSQEQGGDPNKPAARSPRNKSPASTPGPPQGQGPTPGPQMGPNQGASPGQGQPAPQGMGQQPPGGQEGHGPGAPFPHTMGQGPGQHPGQGPSGAMPPVYGYGPGPGIIRPPPGGLDQSQMARARFPGMMPHGMHPGGPPMPPRMHPPTSGMHPQQGQHPLPPQAQGQPSQGATSSAPSPSSVAIAGETSTSTTASGSVDTSVASQNTTQAAEQAGSTHEQLAQEGRGGMNMESSQPTSQDPSTKEESAPGSVEPTKEAQQSQEKPQQEGSQPQQEKSGHTSVLQSYLSGSVPLPSTSHPKTMAEKLKTPAGKSQEQASVALPEEASGSVPAAPQTSTSGAPSSEAAGGSDLTVATTSPQQSQTGAEQQPSAQQAAELAATTTAAPESITTTAPSAAATTSGSTTTSSVPTPGAAGRPMMQGPHPGAMPPYMCFPQRPPFSHLYQAGSLLPLSPHPQTGQSNPPAQAGPSPPSTQASPLVTSTASAPASQSPPVTVSSASTQSTATSSSTAQSASTPTTASQASEESQLASGQSSESEVHGGGQVSVSVSSQTGPSPPVSAAPGATPASTQTGAPTPSQGSTPPCAPAGSVEPPSTTSVQTSSSSQPQGAVTGHQGSQVPATSQPGSHPKEGPPSSGADHPSQAAQPPAASSVPVSSQGEAGHSGPVAPVVKPPQQYGLGKPGPPQHMTQAPQHSQAGPVVSSHAQPGFSTASHASQAGPMPPRYSATASVPPGHPQAGVGRMAPGQGHPPTPGHTQARMSPGYSQGGHGHSFSQAGPMPGHSQSGPMPGHSQAAPVPGHSQAGPMPGHSPTGAFPPGHSQAGPVFPGHSQAGHMPPGFSQAGPVLSHEGPMVSMHSQGSHMPPGYSQASGGPPGYPESGNMPPSHSQAGAFPPGRPQSGQMHPGHIRPGHPHAMHTGQMHPRFSQQGPMPPGFSQAGAMPPGYSQGVPFHHGHPQPGHMASGPSVGPRPRMSQGAPLSPMNMPPSMMQRMPPHHINVQPSSQMGHFMGDRRMPTPDQMSMHSQRMSPRMPGMAGPGAHPPASMGHPGYPGQQPMHTGQPGMGPRPGMPHHPMGPVPPGSRPMGHRFPPHSGVNPLLDPHGPGPRPGLGSQASLMLPPTSSFAQSSAATPLASMSGMVTSVPASPTPPHTPVSSTPPQPLHHLPGSTAAASLPGTSPTFSLAGIEGLVKEEPQEKQGMDCGEKRQDQDEQRIGQNALLKQLLANSHVQKNKAEGAEDSEDSLPQLTPEQQKQLEIIDKMPLCKETEISHEEWESKTPDEREQIMDQNGKGGVSPSNFPNEQSSGQSHSPTQMRRQEYERRRKEYEEARKNRKKGSGILGAGEPKQPTKRKKVKDGKEPVKKRSRKLKVGEPEVEAQVEAIFQQLRAMSPVVLKEPDIAPNYNIVPIYGFSVNNNDQPRYQLMPERGLPGMQPPLLSPPGLGPPALPSSSHLAPSPLLPKPPRIGPRPSESVKSDSPATVISSSSPECSFNDMDESFPALRLIEPAESPQEVTGKMSPTVPIVYPVPIKPDAPQVKEEVDADALEGKLGLLSPKRDVMGDLEALVSNAGKRDMSCKTHALTSSLAQTFRETMDQQVSVTLTLNASAAEDLGGVISAIADLLKIAVPPTYELIRSPSPEMFKLNMTHKEEAVNIQSLMKAKPKYCKHCDVVVLSSGIKRKREDLPSHLREDQVWEEEVTFCSMNCCMQFMMSQRSQPPADAGKDVAASLGEHKSGATDSTPSASPRTSSVASTPPPTTPVSTPLAIIPPSTASSSSTLSPILPSPPVKTEKEKAGKKHRRSSSTTEPQTPKPLVKKWKDTRWKRWDPVIADQPKVSPKTEKGVEELWGKIKTIVAKGVDDTRSCAFCHEVGDGAADGPSRLLNMDVDKYAHLNCSLWSSEVYETLNGALIHVDQAHRRSLTLECVFCHKKGASMTCFRLRCGNSYHLPCAQRAGCKFFHDKTILCPSHINKVVFSEENVIPSLVVHRRVYISRDEDRQVAHMIHQGEGYYLRVGSLTLIQIGQLLPHQIQTGKFHSREYIYPVGFKTSRLYWSMRFLFQRCKYICTIEEKDGRPVFTVEVKEQGYPDIRFQEKTPKECWMHAFEPIEDMRRKADLVKMFPSFITGEDFFGLTEPSIVKVLESLPGTDLLQNYNFRFGRSPLIEMPLAINPTGCARAEPKFRTHFRKPHTLQTSTSRSLPSTVTGVTGDINSPYMKQFVHSKSQQYRRLKTEWKANVFLGRSRIQGLGLFAAKDLEKHTMVIEYIGDLIRNEVANKKEKIYENQNRGVYMFRIDQDTVIDATMAGGPARYINHSCAPNCVAEVVPFERESKIIIITNRRIAKGEELTYDYKFDFEDDQHKIPCCCGASVCRKWMN